MAYLSLALMMLLVTASIADLRTREIPNWISGLMMLIAVNAACFGWGGLRWWLVLTGALAGMALGYASVRFAQFGGGDAKLIAALGALLGPVGLLFLLFWMALAGGVLALIAAARGQRDYAYAPAIAVGYLAYLVWPVGLPQRMWSSW